jgi:hypothetical protein
MAIPRKKIGTKNNNDAMALLANLTISFLFFSVFFFPLKVTSVKLQLSPFLVLQR